METRQEFECACWLGTQAQKGRIRFWVRNLVRREGSSLFMQQADGCFYPDLVCQLVDADGKPGAVRVVEYKGADVWTDTQEDRLIGGPWAERSQGRRRFMMVRHKRWERIDAQLP